MRSRNLWHLLLMLLGLLSSGYTLSTQAAGVVINCSTFGATATPGVYIEGTLGAALVGGGEITFTCSDTIIVPLIQITANTHIDATGQNITLNGSHATPYMFAITTGTPRSELELTNLTITQGVGSIITNLGGKVTLTDCAVTANTPSSSLISNQNTQGSVGRMSLVNTTVSGNTSTSATIFNDGEMILTSSVVSGNSTQGGAAGIYNGGGSSYVPGFFATLILNDSTISDNTAIAGGPGGIRSAGNLTLTRSTVSGNRVNQAGVNGGGIFNLATMNLSNSIVSGNSAPGFGGGIHNTYGSESTITDSTVSNNTAGNGGGGISNYGGHLTINNSTLSSNSARDGGGIYNFDSQLMVTNSTLSGNTGSNRGGGIYNYAPLILTNVTLSGNSAPEGGGIYVFSTNFTPYLSNTLIANSLAGGNCAGLTQYLTDNGYNQADDNTCNLASGSSSSPNLGLLADNGGPTQTHALLPGSPAIDQIPSGANGCGTDITIDQRGVTRPQGANCDIGAYEVAVVSDTQSPVVSAVSATPNPTPPNASVTLTATVNDGSTGNSTITSAEYKIDDGEWTSMNAADDAFDSPSEAVTATLTFAPSQAGTRTVFVRGADASGNTSDGTAYTTVTVMAQDTLHVGAISGTVTLSKKGYTLNATVLVLDQNNVPIPRATAYILITQPSTDDLVKGIKTQTDKSGVAKITVTSKMESAWKICVTNLAKSGYVYDESANVETCETFAITL